MAHGCNDNEHHRLQALYALSILDTAPEASFERIARLARELLETPIANISLIDSDRQWLKATSGCSIGEVDRKDSVCTWTIRQNNPLVVPDLRQDARFANSPLVSGEPFLRFYAGTALCIRGGHNVGALCCLDYQPRTIAAGKLAHLQDLAQLAVEAMELRLVASVDALTGAMMRRAFFDAAQRDIALAKRHESALSCVILDIDHFKAVNDRHGHAAGDMVLRELIQTLKNNLRQSDYIGRLGGEEFALVLRETPTAGATQVAERLRAAVEALVFRSSSSEWQVTASFGVSGLDCCDKRLEDILAQADTALYRAKSRGRNRVEAGSADFVRYDAPFLADAS